MFDIATYLPGAEYFFSENYARCAAAISAAIRKRAQVLCVGHKFLINGLGQKEWPLRI